MNNYSNLAVDKFQCCINQLEMLTYLHAIQPRPSYFFCDVDNNAYGKSDDGA